MKEIEARELLEELFERHSVSSIPAKFYPKPIITKNRFTMSLGGTLTCMEKMYGTFNVKPVTGECWIEFYGLPSPNTVRHEFRHYLEYLAVKYIRKSPTRSKEAEG